jgi:hypothetical protein
MLGLRVELGCRAIGGIDVTANFDLEVLKARSKFRLEQEIQDFAAIRLRIIPQ